MHRLGRETREQILRLLVLPDLLAAPFHQLAYLLRHAAMNLQHLSARLGIIHHHLHIHHTTGIILPATMPPGPPISWLIIPTPAAPDDCPYEGRA
jgi:hypothetical protein